MFPSSRSTLAALLLIGSIGVFYLATIREGHVWGDDHAAYLYHTRNLVEGRPYGEIGYLRGPSSINPLMYPPMFPLLLAPVLHLFGPSLTPMKVECTIFFCCGLFFLYLLLREEGTAIALTTVAMVGLCPYFWDFKDTLLSDFPFLAFCYSALWFAGKASDARESIRREILLGALVGLLIGLAVGVRTVGIILAPVIILFDCWRVRQITAFCVVAGAVSLVVALSPSLALQVKSDYLTPYQKTLTVHALAASPVYYLKCLSVVWENGYSNAFKWVLYGLAAIFALKGFWTRGSSKISILEIFCISYSIFICLLPWGGRRYLMPVMPFYFLYVLIGLRSLTFNRPVVLRAAFCGGAAFLVGLCFIGRYLQHNWREIAGGDQSMDAVELIDFLKSSKESTGPVVFSKARWLAFHTRLVSTDIYNTNNLNELTPYYEKIGTTRFVASRIFHDREECALTRWVEQSGEKLVRTFENDSFTVYQMR